MMLSIVAATAASPGPASDAIAALHFRPPAIPLIQADPFMQTYIAGDNATAAIVRHWDGVAKDTLGLLRIDGMTYRYLGDCHKPPATAPGPVTLHVGQNLSPGKCDISNSNNKGDADCNMRCYSNSECAGYVLDDQKCWLKSCSAPLEAAAGSNTSLLTGTHPPCDVDLPALAPKSVVVYPTRTIFELEQPGKLALTVTFLQSAFTDDLVALSRPVYYVHHDVSSLDGAAHEVQLYLDASASHSVNLCASQSVQWSNWTSAKMRGVKMGSQAQQVLGSKGDRVNIDWGFLHLAASDSASALYAGSAAESRKAFVKSGALPAAADTRQPRKCADDLPALATALDMSVGAGGSASHTVLLAYDDVRSVYYFDAEFKGLWTQTYANIEAALAAASADFDAVLAKSVAHDEALLADLQAVGGTEYAQLCALAYRQTLAAIKPVWMDDRKLGWTFLKEISTNGDMNTMDVIYPASPMLLYLAPELLRQLIVPVLAYANNETRIRFSDPYSPHQLGTYPIANDTTAAQEPMPLENSGNMMFMLLALVQRSGAAAAKPWLLKYMPMLRSWTDELVRTTLFPAHQLCTDDFTGPLANNTNLGQKGIIAIRAFAELCVQMGLSGNVDCESYSKTAASYAATWVQYAYNETGGAHYMMSYNPVDGVDDSWSFKYNLLWQVIAAHLIAVRSPSGHYLLTVRVPSAHRQSAI